MRSLVVQDSDLRSALLLEQAAHCFINMRQPMVRKYAFHMILAGHRFSKAAQVSGRERSSLKRDLKYSHLLLVFLEVCHQYLYTFNTPFGLALSVVSCRQFLSAEKTRTPVIQSSTASVQG